MAYDSIFVPIQRYLIFDVISCTSVVLVLVIQKRYMTLFNQIIHFIYNSTCIAICNSTCLITSKTISHTGHMFIFPRYLLYNKVKFSNLNVIPGYFNLKLIVFRLVIQFHSQLLIGHIIFTFVYRKILMIGKYLKYDNQSW